MPSSTSSTPRRRRPSSLKSIDSTPVRSGSRTVSFSSQSPRFVPNADANHQSALPHNHATVSSPIRRFSMEDDGSNLCDKIDTVGTLADELAEALDEDDEPTASPSHSNRALSHGHHSRSSSEATGTLNEAHSHTTFRRRSELLPTTELTMSEGEDRARHSHLSSQSLDVRIAEIGRWIGGSDASGEIEEENAIFSRMIGALQNLPPQSSLENGASRLMTAHTALATHISNQARALHSLVHHIISPFALPYPPDDIDELLPSVTDLLQLIPSSDEQCLSSLHTLRKMTADLQTTLTYLSDSVYMTRQIVTSSGRKLRAVTDLVTEIRQQAEASEEAIRWIETGQWDSKLSSRNCEKVCGEVIGGFEETCQGWRQRLAAGLVGTA